MFAAGDEKFPNGAKVSDSFDHPTNEYTLTGVLIDSSNAGISKFAERVSAQTRYDYLKRFGIGDGSHIPFAGQANGWLSTPDQWDNQTFYNTAFGQGVSTTIPELAGAYQAIANDGVKVPLSLVESCTKPDGEVADARTARAHAGHPGVHRALGAADDGERRPAEHARTSDRDPRLPDRRQDGHRRDRRERRVQARRVLHDDDRLRARRTIRSTSSSSR